MCRVEYTFFTCGHTHDHSVDCELAQAFGPFFNRTGCVNYDFSSTHPQNQCGKVMGFYCGKTQNGTIIDKSRDALQRMVPVAQDKNNEKNRICASYESYREQALARHHSLDSLADNPTYRNIEHQRGELIKECNALETRRQYLNGLIAHAYRNRHLLAPHTHQPLWDRTSFDFEASIFPPHMLEPIRAQFPTPAAPASRSTANVLNQQQQQQQHLQQQDMGLPPIANFGMTAPPLQQTMSTQQQMGSVTPKRQSSVMDERSPMGRDIIRGYTPEGETREEKAIRYRDQLKTSAAKRLADSMLEQGYDVQQHSVTPVAKPGGLYYSMHSLDVRTNY